MGGTFRKIINNSKPAPVVIDNSAALASQQAEEERKKTLERQRRGIEGTIRTSHTGLLGEKENTLQRKKLLGE